jgi:cytochrome c553
MLSSWRRTTSLFNHVSHNGGKSSIDGTGPIGCTECHHAAQPAAELAKHPPLKTSWPAGRTTTLTAELFTKDPAAAGVAACRDCHARAGQTPKLIAAIPEIKHESSRAMITLTNQQAFHRNCAGCYTEAAKDRPNMKAPKATQCTMCHKKTS